VTLVLIARVGGAPRYRYVSNGTQELAFQPWSSTKFMAAANAAARLRIASENEVHGAWLGRPASETFGGNYGEPSPALGYTFVDGTGSVTVTPDATSGPANRLSTRTIAELLKRLALHREEPGQRLPGIQQSDVETLFYGAASSPLFPGTMGGMSADTAIYVQAGHDIDDLDVRSHGRWRIFSKLGFGNGDFVHAAYACLPELDATGAPIPNAGKELVIVTRTRTGSSTELERDRMLARTYRTILPAIVDGRIP
jgi:hypothetical protein